MTNQGVGQDTDGSIGLTYRLAARNRTYPRLAVGTGTSCSLTAATIAAW